MTLNQRVEKGRVYLPSQLERTPQVCIIVDIVKGGGACTPPFPAWADFSIMINCSPESGRCHSVYSAL
jgi:hypothetical protein